MRRSPKAKGLWTVTGCGKRRGSSRKAWAAACVFLTPWKTLRVSHTAPSPDDDIRHTIKGGIPRYPRSCWPGGPVFDDHLAPFSLTDISGRESSWPRFDDQMVPFSIDRNNGGLRRRPRLGAALPRAWAGVSANRLHGCGRVHLQNLISFRWHVARRMPPTPPCLEEAPMTRCTIGLLSPLPSALSSRRSPPRRRRRR